TADRHIITIEDPIEYLHRDEQSIVTQREIGADCVSFAAGLKGALRQDPDIILVGEMRDLETIETAILAAETGHLVMSTLHTLDARETITRAISAFPEHQRDQIRLILSSVVRGIISQRLVKRADGQGMVPAVEVLLSTALTRECIAIKEKTHELHDAIARGHATYGMQTFDQSLMALYRQGLITYEEAIARAPRSIAEIATQLGRRRFAREAIDATIAALRERGYLDDAALAHRRAEDLLLRRGHGRLRVAYELTRRGVAASVIEDALATVM